MKEKKQIICLALLFFGLGGLHAQEAITATGGEASGSGGTTSYSVGQIGYTSNSGSGGSVSQGVQQAFEIYTTLGINDTSIDLELSVYPNPTANYLTLKVEETDKLSYQLYDLQGKMLKSNTISNNSTSINLQEQPTGVYFLKVFKENIIVKSFKIVKA